MSIFMGMDKGMNIDTNWRDRDGDRDMDMDMDMDTDMNTTWTYLKEKILKSDIGQRCYRVRPIEE